MGIVNKFGTLILFKRQKKQKPLEKRVKLV